MFKIPASELLDGKPVSEEVALAANPLDEKSKENWFKIRDESNAIKKIEHNLWKLLETMVDSKKTPLRVHNHAAADFIWECGNLKQKTKGPEWYGSIYRWNPIGMVPQELIESLSNDTNKLWESTTLENFKENGKYNQMSLSDDGTLYLTIIKPGALESIKLVVWEDLDSEFREKFVSQIRSYLEENKGLRWAYEWEWNTNTDSGPGSIYSFHCSATLLKSSERNIIISWVGKHRQPFIDWGPYSINDALEVQIQEK